LPISRGIRKFGSLSAPPAPVSISVHQIEQPFEPARLAQFVVAVAARSAPHLCAVVVVVPVAAMPVAGASKQRDRAVDELVLRHGTVAVGIEGGEQVIAATGRGRLRSHIGRGSDVRGSGRAGRRCRRRLVAGLLSRRRQCR
jgi:hypothetical protein